MNKEQEKIIDISNKIISEALAEQYEKGIEAERVMNYREAYDCYDRCTILDTPCFQYPSSIYSKDKVRVVKLLQIENNFILRNLVSRDI